jgi:hypothetical protein
MSKEYLAACCSCRSIATHGTEIGRRFFALKRWFVECGAANIPVTDRRQNAEGQWMETQLLFGGPELVQQTNFARCFHDQRITNTVIGFKDHQGAGPFVW